MSKNSSFYQTFAHEKSFHLGVGWCGQKCQAGFRRGAGGAGRLGLESGIELAGGEMFVWVPFGSQQTHDGSMYVWYIYLLIYHTNQPVSILGGGFKYFFIFIPILGETIQFDEHIFQMG